MMIFSFFFLFLFFLTHFIHLHMTLFYLSYTGLFCLPFHPILPRSFTLSLSFNLSLLHPLPPPPPASHPVQGGSLSPGPSRLCRHGCCHWRRLRLEHRRLFSYRGLHCPSRASSTPCLTFQRKGEYAVLENNSDLHMSPSA